MGNSSFVLKDRRGLAKAVKVVLILLIVFASVAVLWIGIKTLLKYNSENIITPNYNVDLKISQVQMVDYNDVSVKIKKTSYTQDIKGVNVIVYDKDNNIMGTYKAPLSELQDNNYQVVLSVDNTSNIKTVEIAPVTLSNSGQEIIGNTADQYKITGTGTVFTPAPEDTGYAPEAVKYCTSASQCKDSDPCTTGACSKGLCSYPKIPGCEFCTSDSDCNDNNSCTENLCVGERCTYPVIDGCQACAYNFQCEDDNSCTADSCVENGCSYTPIANCTSCTEDSQCEDNNSCTENLCSNGRCSYPVISTCKVCNSSSQCNDNNICTNDTCMNNGCVYTPIDNCSFCTLNSQCNDHNGCTSDTCSEGKCSYKSIANCKACNSSSQCNDNNSCTNDGCLNWACVYTATNSCKNCTEASQCADTNPCTIDSCSNGICSNLKIENCTYCTSVLQCEDNNPCTIHACTNNVCSYSQISGCTTCTLNSQCNDNNASTIDNCLGNKCVYTSAGNNVSCTLNSQCNDSDFCTTDSCSGGTCSHVTITSCANNDGCCPVGCTSANDNNCAATAVCGNGIREGTEKCDGTNFGGATCAGVLGAGYTGTLKCYAAGTSNECKFDTSSCIPPCTCPSDNNICTTDICENNACQHIPITDCCTSVSQCTNGGTCKTGVCSNNKCSYPTITSCKSNDGCCASGCNALNDNDCASVCGNGIREGTEKCDDGGKTSGDGCSSSCVIEAGYTCNTATPNVCTKSCSPSCSGKECGSDGCDGSCGSCTNAHGTTSCSAAGICQPVCSSGYTNCDGDRTNGCETCACTPNCGTRTCGPVPNGCGGTSATCGSCSGSCNNGVCTNPQPTGGTIIIDHTTTNINAISTSCINQIKSSLHIAYSYTSHGTQIMAGLDALQAYNSNLYSYSLGGNPSQLDLKGYYGYGNADGFDTGGCYDLSDCNGAGIIDPTTQFLDSSRGSSINVIMWSWCDIAGHDIAGYLNSMKTLITEYPNVKFVFITGHANGGGEGDSSDSQNDIIRNFINTNSFCNTHQCILFDFADIENYDPDGNYFLNKDVDMALNYNGGNWGDQYLSRHPTGTNADLTNLLSDDYGCAHSDTSHGAYLNCALKGQAAWYMFAKIEGCA